jgi:hypothetical protein
LYKEPLDRRLGGLQSQHGYCREEKNLLSLLGIEPELCQPSCSLTAIVTELWSSNCFCNTNVKERKKKKKNEREIEIDKEGGINCKMKIIISHLHFY